MAKAPKLVFNKNCSYDREHLQNISYQLDVLIRLTYRSISATDEEANIIFEEYIKNTGQ